MRATLNDAMLCSMRLLISGIAFAAMTVVTGCVPTVSMHSTRDVAITLTDGSSGAPVADTEFRVVYAYTPADSPLVYHVELRTPDAVQARTDAKGKALIQLADYAWDIYMLVDDGQAESVFFSLNKEIIRDGGVMVSNRRETAMYVKPLMTLELRPMDQSADEVRLSAK